MDLTGKVEYSRRDQGWADHPAAIADVCLCHGPRSCGFDRPWISARWRSPLEESLSPLKWKSRLGLMTLALPGVSSFSPQLRSESRWPNEFRSRISALDSLAPVLSREDEAVGSLAWRKTRPI